jgi:uracil-DNA glycosylase
LNYKDHVAIWTNCKRCPLADRVIFPRGTIPADVLYLAKSPDDAAFTLRQPFANDAIFNDLLPPERLKLDKLLGRPLPKKAIPKWLVAYMVSCRYEKDVIDLKAAMTACWPKVLEVIQLARPKLIVCLGQLVHNFVISQRNSIDLRHIAVISVPAVDWFHQRTPEELALHLKKAQLKIKESCERYC